VTDHQASPPPASRRRAVVLGLSGGLVLLALLIVVAVVVGGSRDGRPSAVPANTPAAASPAQLARHCIAQIKGEQAVAFFEQDIPAGRWGDRVRGTVSSASEPHVLWLFDGDCRPHRSVEVPPRTSRTFTAQVGQVWYYAEASAPQPDEGCACRVFSPASSNAEQRFSDTGSVTFHLG
jgi:hypothetical protein